MLVDAGLSMPTAFVGSREISMVGARAVDARFTTGLGMDAIDSARPVGGPSPIAVRRAAVAASAGVGVGRGGSADGFDSSLAAFGKGDDIG